MKVLVLGGTGLISGAIVLQLVQRGDEVHVRTRGLAEDLLPAKVIRTVGERSEIATAREQIRDGSFDCVIDICGYSVTEANALIQAVKGIVPQVIFCSTTDVFCQAKRLGSYPLTEETRRGAPTTFPYAAQKVACEEILEEAAQSGCFALTIIRAAETYGDARHGPLHPLWHRDYNLWRVKNGLPIIVHEGRSLWCACHADDVALAFINAVGNEKAYGESYNTGGAEFVTWLRYWEIVAGAFSLPTPEFVTIPSDLLSEFFGDDCLFLRENFQFNNVLNCEKAVTELGFSYRTDLETGFAMMARKYGPAWLELGEIAAEDEYAKRYEAVLNWWLRERTAEHASLRELEAECIRPRRSS